MNNERSAACEATTSRKQWTEEELDEQWNRIMDAEIARARMVAAREAFLAQRWYRRLLRWTARQLRWTEDEVLTSLAIVVPILVTGLAILLAQF